MLKTTKTVLALVITLAFLLAVAVNNWLESVVHKAIATDTAERLEKWAPYFISGIDNLPELLTSNDFDATDLEFVSRAQGIGTIFQIKLFDDKARLIYTSDPSQQNLHPTTKGEPEKGPLQVIVTDEYLIESKDGSDKPNRPDHYTEMYAPVKSQQGDIVGVVELYIDNCPTHHLYHSAFRHVSFVIGIVFAHTFGLPALAFVTRARREAEISRTAFKEEFNAILASAAETKTQVAVAYLDIDDFKLVNDENGHEAGDNLLKHVSSVLKDTIGDKALAARFGGDEFVFVVRDCTEGQLVDIAAKVIAGTRKSFEIRGKRISGNISIGGHVFVPYKGSDLDFALHRADMALYQAKTDGKNCMRLFRKEIESERTQLRQLENALYDALNSGAFEVFYQLLLDSKSREYNGFEALLRLPDGQGGYIPPSKFIPVAERMGIITEIGAWVLDKAVTAALQWPDNLVLAVNLSARQFEDGKLIQTVRDVLERHKFPADRLQLEITESMLMEDSHGVAEQLQDLQMLGIGIAMDDFGTGYSSLGYLWKYNFNKIKIDRSFILEIGKGAEKAYEILKTIVNLGHKLNATVTAEGIETVEQAQMMQDLQCDEFQGFHFSHPLPEHEVTKLLTIKNKSAV